MRHEVEALLAGACLLGLGFAGCLGGDEDARIVGVGSEEPPSDVIVEPEPGVYVAENRGVVRGIIRNDAGFAVKDATVVLAQTGFVEFTNETGGFLFGNVTAGDYVLRAEHKDFQPHEEPITVARGNLTQVSIRLLPLVSRGAGQSPHIHDFWQGQTQVTIMDADVDLAEDPGGGYGINLGYAYWRALSAAYYPNCNCSNPPGWPIFLPEAAIIFPGTAEIRVTLSWDSTRIGRDQLNLVYLSADKTDVPSNHRYLTPKASGATHVIRVNSTMADSGHQTFTLWRFWANGANPTPTTANPTGFRPGYALGPLHVKMVLVKADL